MPPAPLGPSSLEKCLEEKHGGGQWDGHGERVWEKWVPQYSGKVSEEMLVMDNDKRVCMCVRGGVSNGGEAVI